ncbi:DMP19 family protein [Bacillus mesophilum]|uniref:DUF4375 domain-containing protein n=1 Tax=Bacillus mesophilum TaxID=1071718 RepID=A0A7V7RKX1_9BACI|nr:DUF4375 domain-containing protein [Bacillus mesophilum]KAB2331968.1 DUF4375 domain-containing protein [Bacillus mesophilum]
MKPKMNKKELAHKDDIWNAVISALPEYVYSAENKTAKEAFTVFQYYSEMESGGHEILLNWTSDYIKEVGIRAYVKELIESLEKINAHDYAAIIRKYGEQMWKLHISLENDEVEESEYYEVIEKADAEYYSLDDQLAGLLEAYFVEIYEELIDVVED